MKKFLILSLSLLLLLSGCGKTEEIPQTGDVPVETSVRTETEEPTAAPTGAPLEEAEGETQTPQKTESAYRLVRMTVLDETGGESWYQEYSYDDYGREIYTAQYTDGMITYSAITSYTADNGYVTEIQQYDISYSIRYTCDEAGRVYYQETVEDGIVTDSTAYTYDEYGNQLTLKMLQDGEKITFSYEYTYDAAGNQLTRKEYLDGEQVGMLEMEYDSAGREIASVYYNTDGSVSYTTESRWEGSTETRESRDAEGYTYMTQVTVCDETGNILTQETWQDGIMLSCTEYIYEDVRIIG